MLRILPIGLVLFAPPAGLRGAQPTGDRTVVENTPGLVDFWTFGEEAGHPRRSRGTKEAYPLVEVGGATPRVAGGPYSGYEGKGAHDDSGTRQYAMLTPPVDGHPTETQQTVTTSDTPTPYPRIAMLWAPLRGDRSLKSYARHDLIMMGSGALGLRHDREPRGLATGFTKDSIRIAQERIRRIRRFNPDAIILADLLFYEYPDEWLPEDHPWWLRKDGKRLQFWPGTHRMDWNQPEYRDKIVKQTVALQRIKVDGVFYDNLRNEPQPWIAFLTSLRKAVGNDFLVLANAGYAVGEYDFAAPFLNGIMYESGWSHDRTEWDGLIEKMQRTETLLREPRISLIERFEETRRRAGWPGDPRRGKKPKDDPAARRWSLCFSLIVGDFYYLFSDNTSHQHDWYPEYDAKIGQPKAPGHRLNLHAWTRSYTGAEVYVNLPGAQQPLEIKMPFEARDCLTGDTGWQFSVAPGDGRVLTRIQ